VFVTRNGVFVEKVFLKRDQCRQKVYLEETQDKSLGADFTSDANVVERVEMPVARELPPPPRRSERARVITGEHNILMLDNDNL
jgi:hypothetical protein